MLRSLSQFLKTYLSPRPLTGPRIALFQALLSLSVLTFAGCQDTGVKQVEISHPFENDASQTVSADAASTGETNHTASIGSNTPLPGETAPIITRWVDVPQLPVSLAIFESVFWEPDDTRSLRAMIQTTNLVQGKKVLEVGTGSGLISLCCLKFGAAQVVATDINPAAIQNAIFNAGELGLSENLECRLVPRRAPGAWTVLRDGERFDLIISNPPWENQTPTTVADFALYDPNFELLKSLVHGAQDRLQPGGRMLLAYGCVSAIRRIESECRNQGLQFSILDDRQLDQLPEVFLPGMLMEISVPDRPPGEQVGSGN
ncbi:MAG: 50S ribosomal protein L11 methyltransferase [Planctomycetaceae bacterium]